MNIGDYFEKVETICSMVGIEMSGQDPWLVEASELLNKMRNLEDKATRDAQNEGPYSDPNQLMREKMF